MRLAYDNKIMDATLTASSENANYPAANLKDRRLSRIYMSDEVETLLDDDCSSLTAWTDNDKGDASTTQVTFGGKSCFKLDSGPNSAANDDYAMISRDVGSFGDYTTVEIEVNHVTLGTYSASDYTFLGLSNGTTYAVIVFGTDGLRVLDGVSYNEVGTDLVSTGTWQTWRFVIDWTAQTIDVYLENVLQASGVDCSHNPAPADGTIRLLQYGYTTNNCISYVDGIKVVNNDLQWVKIAGTDIEASCLMIAAHDIGSDATITLEGNDTDVWTSPSFSETVTHNENIMALFFTAETYNYWRIKVTNAGDDITIGGLFLGEYLIAPALDLGYTMDDNDSSAVSISGSGQVYADEGYQYRTGKFSIPEFTHTQRSEMREFFATVGTHTPYYLTKWYEHLDKESVLYCINTKEHSWKQDKDDPNKYSMTLEVREVY